VTTMPPINTGIHNPPAAPRKKRALLGFAVITGVLLVGCCGGYAIGSAGEPEPQVISSPSPYPVTVVGSAAGTAVAPAATAAVTSTQPSPTKAAPAPAPTIDEGTWTVGDDFPAGTYKLREPATSMCYWGIYKSGTNQGDIIENDIVTGGRPTVTLKKGQDFKSDCGVWVKTK
jgi:hypothetical protein